MVTPGQTTNVLLTANQTPESDSSGMFVMAARPYRTSVFPFDNSTTIGFLRYKNTRTEKIKPLYVPFNLSIHNLPQMEDTNFATEFSDKLRSIASSQFPCNVPRKIDKLVITAISLNLQDCPTNTTCKGYDGKRNTAGVPKGGWAAIRLKADNPGVWFIHCHFEEHTSWGLVMAFIVKDGPKASEYLLPPPQDFPSCLW